jgi:hypothetical protein
MKQLTVFLSIVALTFAVTSSGRSQIKVHTTVSDETVDKILHDLNIKFQKNEKKEQDNAFTQYDFKRGEQSFRLFNYGGKDLWIECHHDLPLKLEDLNRWNRDAKFSRAVLLPQKEKQTEKEKTVVSLESQLDCLGTVTDAMIKQFVNRFDEEAKKFVKTFPK